MRAGGMSLIVGRKIGSELRVIGDTKITVDQAAHPLLPTQGRLKCIITSPTRCVAFAGIAELAERALSGVFANPEWSKDQVISHLLHEHNEYSRTVDFVVAIA